MQSMSFNYRVFLIVIVELNSEEAKYHNQIIQLKIDLQL